MRRLLGGAFAIIGMLAVTAAALGEEIKRPDSFGTVLGWPTELDGRYPVGTPPGDGWNYVSGDGKKFSSVCIGTMRSPQCVVDTMMACTAWSDLDAGWPYESGAQEFHNHPICRAMNNNPKPNHGGIDVLYSTGSEPENQMYFYKIETRVVDQEILESEGTPWTMTKPDDCEICDGGIAVIAVFVTCFPDPALAGVERGGEVHEYLDYPQGLPYTYCIDVTSRDNVLFLKEHPTEEEWYIGGIFDLIRMGSRARPWPLMETWITDFHQRSLPGMCSPLRRGIDECR